ncbi:MAG TPA: trypsin-like peptidase domain-containing protein [Candidatus Dormibacteraeota bacterium]
MALIVTAGVAAGSVGVVLVTRSSSTSSQISGVPGNLAPLPTVPPASSNQGSASLDPTAIAARVDPALVDINVTLGGQGTAAGTGIILTSSGEVLTNNHVVEGATSIAVQVNGSGQQYQATVIGVDPTDDVALVQMTGASGLPTAPLGNSSSVAVGDQIVALGNALGSGGTPAPTTGVVTALDQTITASDAGGVNPETLTGMIEVRAAIQPGDSGGPMADSSGRVIAMTTAGSARVRRTGTIGFGIPINKALTIAQQIQSGSGPNVQAGQRGILGVQIDTAATGASGAVVAQVEAGSPAEGAGITGGDVITGIDSTSIGSADALRTALQGRRPGDTVTVHWTDQSGQQHSARVALVAGPPA